MRLLLDENLDWRLRRDLLDHQVESVPLIGPRLAGNTAITCGALNGGCPLFISVATPVRGVPVFRSWRDRRRTAPWLQSAPKATSFRRRHGCNYLPSPTLRRDKQPLSSWIVASFATYGSLRRAKSGLWWLGKKDLSIPRVDPR